MGKRPELVKTDKKGVKRYRVSLIGTMPMLQNAMTDETLEELLGGKGARKGPKLDITKEQRCEPKLYQGPNGEFGIPVENLFAALKGAGRSVAYEAKSKISTATSTKLGAFFKIVPQLVTESGDGFIPFVDQAAGWVPDTRRGVLKNGASSVAVAIVRPKFKTWALEVIVDVDEEKIAIDKIIELFNIAGVEHGLCDKRPNKNGEMGTFALDKFEFIERVQRAKAATIVLEGEQAA